jgi:hypothetical protein
LSLRKLDESLVTPLKTPGFDDHFDHELVAIALPELAQDFGQVILDARASDEEPRANAVKAIAHDDELKDLGLSRGQLCGVGRDHFVHRLHAEKHGLFNRARLKIQSV